jgi:hypothetical protein
MLAILRVREKSEWKVFSLISFPLLLCLLNLSQKLLFITYAPYTYPSFYVPASHNFISTVEGPVLAPLFARVATDLHKCNWLRVQKNLVARPSAQQKTTITSHYLYKPRTLSRFPTWVHLQLPIDHVSSGCCGENSFCINLGL